MSMSYSPKGGASALHQPSVHGPGQAKPPGPADTVSKGGMSHHTQGAAKCLGEWGRASDAPCKDGPMKSY